MADVQQQAAAFRHLMRHLPHADQIFYGLYAEEGYVFTRHLAERGFFDPNTPPAQRDAAFQIVYDQVADVRAYKVRQWRRLRDRVPELDDESYEG